MTSIRTKLAKAIIGIICAIFILGTIFMTTILLIFKGRINPDEMTIRYSDLPNVCGDSCVYVSENFFVDNKLNIPTEIEYQDKRQYINSVSINSVSYYGRSEKLGYDFVTSASDESVLNGGYIAITCSPNNIAELKNKQVHNGFTYGLEYKQFSTLDGSSYNSCVYTVDFKRNAHTSKKCQLRFVANVKEQDGVNFEDYKGVCDSMFYSLLNNVVYRNV